MTSSMILVNAPVLLQPTYSQIQPRYFNKENIMPKNMQNLVLLIEPAEEAYNIDLKGENMCLNRFSIDEDAAFELSGVYYLKKWSWKKWSTKHNFEEFDDERESKGKWYLK